MASTYSTNLKLQLMATGENSTTWGATTNVNLGTALEEATVGSATVTFSSADVTLTLTDVNTSQPARNLRLNLTGTTGGARNLIVPALNKVFIVSNGCADAITVKNATGTGIAVPAGKTLWVYNNGTDVVDVITHLTSLTLASALPTSSGGTGLTTFTGANSAIYSTSASVLTAGTLPSGAGGTGLTGFTAANNAIYSTSASALTAGTLPVAAGGTGQNTYTNGQLLIGNTTGGTLNKTTLIEGTGVTITNGPGTITIASTGSVTSVNLSTGSTGLLVNGTTSNVITSSGTWDLTGTLVTANGGTNLTGFTAANNAIYSTSPSALTAGTLPVTAGGTGITSFGAGIATFLGTPTSANLAAAVTDETGSGSLVFATAPTITLNNATGLPLTTGVTGTLPVANGGTGGTTKASALFNLGIAAIAVVTGRASNGTCVLYDQANITSVTRTATLGIYTVDFTTALADSNYAVFIQCGNLSSQTNYNAIGSYYDKATTGFTVRFQASNANANTGPVDPTQFSIQVISLG